MNESAHRYAGGQTTTPSSADSAVTINRWLQIFSQTYREDLSEELVLGYHITLQDCPASLLEAAFPAAMRRSKSFRPCPGEVFDQVEIVDDRQPRIRAPELPEARLTLEEAWVDWEETQRDASEFRAKLHIVAQEKRPPKPLPRDGGLVIQTREKVEELERQGVLIKRRYPAKPKLANEATA